MDWRDIWASMDAGERTQAAEALCHGFDRDSDELQTAMAWLSVALNMRPETVARMRPAKLAKHLSRGRTPDDTVIEAMLRALHLGEREPMLALFLDALGIEHEGGSFDGSGLAPPAPAALEEAARRTLAEFSSERVSLYIDVLRASDDGFWAGLAEVDIPALAATPMPTIEEEPQSRRETNRDAATDGSATPVHRIFWREGQRFDILDRVVIDRIVESVGRNDGALSPDDVRELVDTVIHANLKRPWSYFHLGFLDVMQQARPSVDLPEINDDRRRWYLCGALSGYVRRSKRDDAREFVDKFVHDFQAMGRGGHDAVALAAPLLFKTCARADDPGSFLEFVSAEGLAAGGPPLVHEVTELATRLLREGRPHEAHPLLELALRTLEYFTMVGRSAPAEYIRDVERRQAHCLRMTGRFDEAEALLRKLLEEGADEHEGMIRADLGLLAAGFHALEEVELPPDPDQHAAFAARLAPAVGDFEAAAASPANEGAHGEFCLGVRALALRDPEAALPLMERAVSEMQKRPNVYDRNGLLSRARLYLALAIAESLAEPHAPRIPSLIEKSVFRIGLPPESLLRAILVGLASMDASLAKDLAEELQSDHEEGLIEALADAELLRAFPGARKALLARGDERTRSAKERFADYRRVFASACKANDSEQADQALDRMEEMALHDDVAPDFLDVLDEVETATTIWTQDEIDFARVRHFETRGEVERARSSVARIAHRWLSSGDPFHAAGAVDLVEHIRSLGVEPSENIAKRAAKAQRPPEAEADPQADGRILFIGGDERQARYDEGLLSWVEEQWPKVSLAFEHPGWSSNWFKKFESFERRMKKADVVVLMPYVRTNMGRRCRRACSELKIPWVPCTTTGENGIRRSIARAVMLLGKRKVETA